MRVGGGSTQRNRHHLNPASRPAAEVYPHHRARTGRKSRADTWHREARKRSKRRPRIRRTDTLRRCSASHHKMPRRLSRRCSSSRARTFQSSHTARLGRIEVRTSMCRSIRRTHSSSRRRSCPCSNVHLEQAAAGTSRTNRRLDTRIQVRRHTHRSRSRVHRKTAEVGTDPPSHRAHRSIPIPQHNVIHERDAGESDSA